ncbi:MAG: ABC transporter ATP-binding protein [Ruminococcaceae bacterium]|nr:ABC transporter ATP-binding protein [Oscillospiraceae bacterium]
MYVPALKCEHLNKSYGKSASPVLSDFNITVPAGKIVGLLGPNGCGKSTFMKLVSGLLVPDSGTIEVCGVPQGEKTNALVSYLPERPYFSPSMKVDELIDFFCDFYSDFDEIIARKMLSDLGIKTAAKLRTLSKGTKEKVQLVLVMSRRARLYLLDEPIGGVDPASRDYILRTIIGNYNTESSIIITTHLINDIEPVLDEFAFMGFGGKVLLGGDAEKAREESGKTLDELFREVFRCSQSF